MKTGVAESLPDLRLDAFCRMARSQFGVGAASICLAGDGGAWIDLAPDFPAEDWRFALGLADHPDMQGPSIVVADTHRGAGIADRPYVGGPPGLRFIASAPIGAEDGRLTILDDRPRALSFDDVRRLDDLAGIAGSIVALHRQATAAIKREEGFRLLADMSTDTIVRGALDGIRTYISPSLTDLLGYLPSELIGTRAADFVHPDDIAPFRVMMGDLLAGRLERARTEHRQRHKDGSWVWVEAFVRLTRNRHTGAPDGYVTSVRGISHRREIEARLVHLAGHDELTGLPNRSQFRDRLLAETALIGTGHRFALLWLDIDRFKEVNDRLGHPAGDALLREAAARFRAVVDADDLVARIGGDEFAIIRSLRTQADDAALLAERLIATMAAPFSGGSPCGIGLSVGIAVAPEGGTDPDGLLAAADQALYAAKSAGRNTWRIFRPAEATA